ncbi:MAG: TonB-dependent receptor [Gallionellaceae bacterium]
MSHASIGQEGRRQIAVLATVILVFLAVLGWGLWALLGGTPKKSPRPPMITLLTPPPPPPPPPKFEKKPDPPKEQKEIKVEQPVPKQDTPPPSPELKMEGPAGSGPSAFAAGKVTSDDVSKIGTGGGEKSGLFNPFTNYANLLKGELQRYLRKDNDLRQRRYTVEISVWVGGGGEIKRFELLGSTGDSGTDEAIKQAMSSLPGFDQTPPANMPQPIRLRIITAG